MASKVRKRFEIDERVMTQEQDGTVSALALKEVKRKVKLNRTEWLCRTPERTRQKPTQICCTASRR